MPRVGYLLALLSVPCLLWDYSKLTLAFNKHQQKPNKQKKTPKP